LFCKSQDAIIAGDEYEVVPVGRGEEEAVAGIAGSEQWSDARGLGGDVRVNGKDGDAESEDGIIEPLPGRQAAQVRTIEWVPLPRGEGQLPNTDGRTEEMARLL
jgi:hypothetical protein